MSARRSHPGRRAATAAGPRRAAAVTAAAATVAAVELATHRDAARAVVDGRFWGTAPDAAADRESAFWYVTAGLVLVPTAAAIHRLEAAGSPALRPVGAATALFGLAGGVAKPTSPFWLFAPLGAALLRRPAVVRRRPIVGWALGGVAVAHLATTAVFYRDGARALLDEGPVAAVDRSPDEPDALFWATATAALVAIAGLATPAPAARRRLGRWLAGVGLVGTAAHPASALPALAAAGWLVRRRPGAHAPEAAP